LFHRLGPIYAYNISSDVTINTTHVLTADNSPFSAGASLLFYSSLLVPQTSLFM